MAYYNSISKGYDELYKEEQLMKLAIIKNNVKINKNTRILDVGCGTGISSDFGCFVVGIDSSIGLLKQNKSIRKILGNAEMLPFKDNSFDCVISVTAIHNFEGINEAIKEIKRVCNGKFVFTVLRKSRKSEFIEDIIKENFLVEKLIKENKDIILFCR